MNIFLHGSGSMQSQMQMSSHDIDQQHDSEAVRVKQCVIWQDLLSEMVSIMGKVLHIHSSIHDWEKIFFLVCTCVLCILQTPNTVSRNTLHTTLVLFCILYIELPFNVCLVLPKDDAPMTVCHKYVMMCQWYGLISVSVRMKSVITIWARKKSFWPWAG